MKTLSEKLGVFADRNDGAVRLWTAKCRTLLTPSEARGIAFTLMVSADRAEGRNKPGPKLEEDRDNG